MAICPFASWCGPVPNRTVKGMQRPVRGLILHIEEGTEIGTDDWFHQDEAQASAHFGNPKSGQLNQWVDTDDKAWAEVSGNPYWISLENEGNSGQSLTENQLENAAQLLAWLYSTEGIPLQISDAPNVPGLGWHGMGGDDWGGHFDCPGEPIKAQRPQIIARSQQILNNTTDPKHPPQPLPTKTFKTEHPTISLGASGDVLTLPGLKARGFLKNFQSICSKYPGFRYYLNIGFLDSSPNGNDIFRGITFPQSAGSLLLGRMIDPYSQILAKVVLEGRGFRPKFLVKHLQARLGLVAINGTFDSKTQDAVKTFQSRNSLTVDGLVGSITWAKLHAVLQIGSQGDAVAELQRALGTKPDGDFGTATREALLNFQRNNGLTVDGIAGFMTYQGLLR